MSECAIHTSCPRYALLRNVSHRTTKLTGQQRPEKGTDMTDNAKPAFAGTSAAPCSDFDRGVWFRAACTGLWYRCKESAGDIDAWKEDGVLHVIEDSPNAVGERPLPAGDKP